MGNISPAVLGVTHGTIKRLLNKCTYSDSISCIGIPIPAGDAYNTLHTLNI